MNSQIEHIQELNKQLTEVDKMINEKKEELKELKKMWDEKLLEMRDEIDKEPNLFQSAGTGEGADDN